MTWAVIVVRTLVGLAFFLAGLTYFLGVEPPQDGMPELAKTYMTVMGPTHYMTVVKVLELVGGLFLLTGRLAPLGIVLLTPVAVNILLFDLLIMRQPALGVVFTLLLAFLVYGYRRYFAPIFTANARIDPV